MRFEWAIGVLLWSKSIGRKKGLSHAIRAIIPSHKLLLLIQKRVRLLQLRHQHEEQERILTFETCVHLNLQWQCQMQMMQQSSEPTTARPRTGKAGIIPSNVYLSIHPRRIEYRISRSCGRTSRRCRRM